MNIELSPPAAVGKINNETAFNLVKLEQDTIDSLEQQATEFISAISEQECNSNEFKNHADRINSMGVQEIREAAGISSRMLEGPLAAIKSGIFDESSPISQALLELRNTVENLDPSNHKNLLNKKKLLGFIPFGNNLKNYFRKYQSAQSHIEAIICSLNNGKDQLLKDNASIEGEKLNLWNTMISLEKYIYLGKKLDEKISKNLNIWESEEPEKAAIIKNEILYYVRQKVQDLLTQMAVSVQGYLAMDMIRKNNTELIKGVDRATTTTVSALRTAVTVAQALANEKLVLDQITALNETTGTIIEGTSQLLKSQAADIHQKSTNTTIEIEKIKTAFDNIYETMNMIENYKSEALSQMEQTVNELTSEVDKAQTYLAKI